MIQLIFEMLYLSEHYGQSEEIEIAKGKHEIPQTFKEAVRHAKRRKEWQKRK